MTSMNRIEKLREYLNESPNDSFLQHALALEHVKMGEDEKARALFESILQHDEDYVGSYYHLGKLLERTGDHEAALEIYQRGMKVADRLQDRHAGNELRSAWEELSDEW